MWTQDDIDSLKEAIKTGVLSVRYDGPPARTIVYQSLAEMRKLLAEMVSQVGGPDKPPRYRLGATRKGV